MRRTSADRQVSIGVQGEGAGLREVVRRRVDHHGGAAVPPACAPTEIEPLIRTLECYTNRRSRTSTRPVVPHDRQPCTLSVRQGRIMYAPFTIFNCVSK
jgi:hypothetical protein